MQNRSEVYQALAELLSPPTPELAGQVAGGGVRRFLAEALGGDRESLEPLERPGNPEAVSIALRDGYYRLFQHPVHRLELAESVYKPWAPATLVGQPHARETGLLMGETAYHLLELYRMTGHSVPETFAGRPDHLVLELAFMAYLVDHHSPGEQLQFLTDHLDWLPELRKMAASIGECYLDPFYAAVLAAVEAWVEQDRRTLAFVPG